MVASVLGRLTFLLKLRKSISITISDPDLKLFQIRISGLEAFGTSFKRNNDQIWSQKAKGSGFQISEILF